MAQANVAAQQAQIAVLNQQKDYQKVVAPFDGVVTQRNIDVGSLVQADATTGTFMFTVMQTDIIRTQVYRAAGPGVRRGAGRRGGRARSGAARSQLPRQSDAHRRCAAADTRTLLTEIDVPNPDGALPPGIYCTVELHIPRKVPSLIVPADAIVFNSRRTARRRRRKTVSRTSATSLWRAISARGRE